MLTKSTPHQDQADLGGSRSPVPNYSSRFDMWLLRHLYSSLGNPQIRITMGARSRSRHRRLFQSPPSQFVIAAPFFRFYLIRSSVSAMPIRPDGSPSRVVSSLCSRPSSGPCLRSNLAICIPELLRLSWPFCSAIPCGAPARTSISITIWAPSSSASGLTRSSYIPGPILFSLAHVRRSTNRQNGLHLPQA